jgi:hypothetical protein
MMVKTSFTAWVDLLVLLLHLLLSSSVGWFFLPQLLLKEAYTLEERMVTCSCLLFISMPYQIWNSLSSVCWPSVGLSKPTFDGFWEGKDFLHLFFQLSTYCTMDHEKNVQSCIAHIKLMHGFYWGTYESHCPYRDDHVDLKTTMLIWDTGASFGLTPFRSDFINYVKCDIPARDSPRPTRSLVLEQLCTSLPMSKDYQYIFLAFCITHLRQMFIFSLHWRTARCMVDTQKSMAPA